MDSPIANTPASPRNLQESTPPQDQIIISGTEASCLKQCATFNARTLEQLPDNCKIVILAYITSLQDIVRLSGVCKSLQKLCRQHVQHVDLSVLQHTPLEQGLYILEKWNFNKCVSIKWPPKLSEPADTEDLDTREQSDYNHSLLKLIAEKFCNLQSIAFNPNTYITDETIGLLVVCFPQLRAISLGGCPEVTDASLVHIANALPHLSTLTLASCRDITDDGIEALAQHCQGLNHLTLIDINRITDFGLQSIAQYCPQLKTLRIGQYRSEEGCLVTHAGIQAILQDCPNLNELGLHKVAGLSDLYLETIADEAQNLTSLSINGSASSVTDRGLEALANGQLNLTTLFLTDFSEVTDRGIQALITQSPNLQQLELDYCPQLTDDTLRVIAQSCKELVSLSIVAGFSDEIS